MDSDVQDVFVCHQMSDDPSLRQTGKWKGSKRKRWNTKDGSGLAEGSFYRQGKIVTSSSRNRLGTCSKEELFDTILQLTGEFLNHPDTLSSADRLLPILQVLYAQGQRYRNGPRHAQDRAKQTRKGQGDGLLDQGLSNPSSSVLSALLTRPRDDIPGPLTTDVLTGMCARQSPPQFSNVIQSPLYAASSILEQLSQSQGAAAVQWASLPTPQIPEQRANETHSSVRDNAIAANLLLEALCSKQH